MTVADTLADAIAAVRAGHREQARAALLQILEADDRNEQAWLWLSGVLDTPEERRVCLENVLTINPTNPHALQGMQILAQQHPPIGAATAPIADAPPSAPPVAPAAPSASTVRSAAGPSLSETLKLSAPSAAPAEPSLGETLKLSAPPATLAGPSLGETLKLPAPPAAPAESLSPNLAAEAGEPCPYCGAATLQRQRACPKCRKSLMVRTAVRAQRSLPLTIMASLYALSAVGALFGGGFLIVTLIAAASVASSIGQELPSSLIVAVVVGVLVMLILVVAMTVGLFQRKRWAYIAHIGNLILSALLAIAQVIFAGVIASAFLALSSQANPSEQADLAGAMGSMGGTVLCNVIILALWIALTVLSHRDFYGPMARITMDGVKLGSDAYNMGLRFRDAGMWHMAARAWEHAAGADPNDPQVRHALGLAYAQLRRFEQAIAALREAARLQPHNPRIADDLAAVERLAV